MHELGEQNVKFDQKVNEKEGVRVRFEVYKITDFLTYYIVKSDFFVF